MTETVVKAYTPEELVAVLAAHRKWLLGDASGARATLAGATLARAILDADLPTAPIPEAECTCEAGVVGEYATNGSGTETAPIWCTQCDAGQAHQRDEDYYNETHRRAWRRA